MTTIRGIPVDPSIADVTAALYTVDDRWALADAGDQDVFAVEAIRAGEDPERMIAVMIPVRLNKTDEHTTIRLLISTVDAVGLSDNLAHTVQWLDALARLEQTKVTRT